MGLEALLIGVLVPPTGDTVGHQGVVWGALGSNSSSVAQLPNPPHICAMGLASGIYFLGLFEGSEDEPWNLC